MKSTSKTSTAKDKASEKARLKKIRAMSSEEFFKGMYKAGKSLSHEDFARQIEENRKKKKGE